METVTGVLLVMTAFPHFIQSIACLLGQNVVANLYRRRAKFQSKLSDCIV